MGPNPTHEDNELTEPDPISAPLTAARLGTSDTQGTESQTAASPVAPYRFLQRHTSAAKNARRTSRQDSISSVDTADLMDHRQAQYSTRRDSRLPTDTFANSYQPTLGTFISRRRRSSIVRPIDSTFNPFPHEFNPHVKSPLRSKSYASPTFIERLMHNNGSTSRTPLLSNKLASMPDYESLEDIDRSTEALAVDIDHLNSHYGSTGLNPNDLHDSATRNRRANRNLGDDDYSDIMGSELASRRSSAASSLRDVCLPIDSPGIISSSDTGCGFELSYLEEFAAIERKELLELQETYTSDATYTEESGQAVPRPLMSHTVNEIDMEGGRLRPHRGVPWDNSMGGGSQSKATGKHKKVYPNSPDGVTKKERNKGISAGRARPKFSTNFMPNITNTQTFFNFEDSPLMRFTYFREDLESTVHSPNISGLLQPGQSFDDLFNVSVYNQTAYSGDTQLSSQDIPSRGSVPELSATHSDAATSSGAGPSVAFSSSVPQNVDVRTLDPLSRRQSQPTKDHVIGSGHTTPGATEGTTGQLGSEGVPLSHASTAQQPSESGISIEPSPFWLDVLNPTEDEMKVLSKAFGIHPLTTEDIFLGETREKVELFRNYYLVCFRSFDIQDEKTKRRAQTAQAEESGISNHYESQSKKARSNIKTSRATRFKKSSSELTPLNMYIIVFHDGVITVSCFFLNPLTFLLTLFSFILPRLLILLM